MQQAFERIKTVLSKLPVLAYPNFSNTFIVSTNTSNKALGAVLSQMDEHGREHPIQYASRCLNASEQNYSTFEKEALAVVFALKRFRPYLLTGRLTLFTDHQALRYVFNHRNPHGRIVRWMSLVAEYDFEIRYKPGKESSLADFLSRPPDVSEECLTLNVEPQLKHVFRYLECRPMSDNVKKPPCEELRFMYGNS